MNAPYDYYLQDVLFAVCEEELVVFIKVKCHLVENWEVPVMGFLVVSAKLQCVLNFSCDL